MSPGQTTPPEGGTSTSTTSSKGLSKGAIIGIAIGSVGAIALIGLLFFLIGRSRRNSTAEKTSATAPAVNPGGEAGQVTYGDHPPPGYYGNGQTEAWGTKGLVPPAPPLSPYNPHASMYGSPPPTNPHASWAPSELGGETNPPERVEIYTPGIDDRVPLNNPPKNP